MPVDALKLPDLVGSKCYYFEACGRLVGSKRRKEAPEPSVEIARVQLKEQTAFLRFVQGGDKGPNHLHVDLALTRAFTRKRPTINSTRAKISSEIANYNGRTLDMSVFGQFGTLSKNIPQTSGVVFAGPSVVVSTINNIVVEVGGAHLIFRNEGFVRTIDWQLYHKEMVFVDILARCEVQVTPSYLADLFARLSNAHKTYVLGRSDNASLS